MTHLFVPLREINLNFSVFFSEDSMETPVMIHRAILGSVERFIAILCENYGGKWCVSLPWSLYSSLHVLISYLSFGRPFWLSPRQAVVIPVAKNYEEYAKKVRDDVYASGFMCDTDLDDSTTMNKKIRNGQMAQYNFIFGVFRRPTVAIGDAILLMCFALMQWWARRSRRTAR